MKELLAIEAVAGYMLKAMKLGKDLSEFKDEFKAIRHGRYDDFIALIGGDLPKVILYDTGTVKTGYFKQFDYGDFMGLINSRESLQIFYNKCYNEYGELNDLDLCDNVYYHAVMFEISLRMHANNYNLLSNKSELKVVISKLCAFLKLSQADYELLDNGRKFINFIKHKEGKKNFTTWEQEVLSFKKACLVIIKYELTINLGYSFSNANSNFLKAQAINLSS